MNIYGYIVDTRIFFFLYNLKYFQQGELHVSGWSENSLYFNYYCLGVNWGHWSRPIDKLHVAV